MLSSTLRSITLLFSLYLTFVTATPLPPSETTSNLNPLEVRTPEPVSAVAFTDWTVNVIMLGGSQSYGMWIPPDGKWHNLDNVQCLDLPAYAIGACSATTVDKIGVAAGNGPCSFVGSDGWAGTLSGKAGEGYYYVGPPQTIKLAACGPVTS